MTDQELKLALAKMLPELISLHANGKFYWCASGDGFIQDTEWLHVCWLVEQEMTQSNWDEFEDSLWDITMPSYSGNRPWNLGHAQQTRTELMRMLAASWQQRATALCLVKGIVP